MEMCWLCVPTLDVKDKHGELRYQLKGKRGKRGGGNGVERKKKMELGSVFLFYFIFNFFL